MQNKIIPVTVRLPKSLNLKLKNQAAKLGFTKTGMLKISIHHFLKEVDTNLNSVDTSLYEHDASYRMVLNLNEFMNSLLVEASSTYSLSINAVVTRVCILASLYYEELLSKLGFDD